MIKDNFIYQFEQFQAFPIIAAFSNRKYNLGFKSSTPDKIKENRSIFLSKLGIDSKDLVCAQQVHKGNVFIATNKDKGRGHVDLDGAIADVDSLVTQDKNVPLGICTADCLSVFLYEPAQNIIAMVHAGWKSTRDKICVNTVKLMQDKFNIQSSKILAAFGPALRSCCYEVDEEFKSYFPKSVGLRNNKLYFDNILENKMQLQSCGIKEANIFDCNICTVCNLDEFFSYRAEGEAAGRMLSVIMLK